MTTIGRLPAAALSVATASIGFPATRRHTPVPAAETALALATALQSGNKMEHALAAFYQAVETDPDFLAAHDWLVPFRPHWWAEAVRQERLDKRDNPLAPVEEFDKRVDAKYEEWRRRFPDSLGILYGMAVHLYGHSEMAKQYLLELAMRDPTRAAVYVMLAGDALMSGDQESYTEYLRIATTLEPASAEYAYDFARSLEFSRRQAAIEAVIDRFPYAEIAALALYELAEEQTSDASRIAYLERLRAQFPPAEFSQSAEGMTQLFGAYLRVDPSQAVNLARDMLAPKGSAQWAARMELAQTLVQHDPRHAR
jgi:Tfp pilus assembly protein PilF